MLRLRDPATGDLQPLVGALTVCVCDAATLRPWVVADLLRRTGDLSGLRVRVTSDGPAPSWLSRANVHPPVDGAPVADLHLAGRVAEDEAAPGGDLLAQRLRVLLTPYGEPTAGGDAAQHLTAWRSQVAQWAELASAPIDEAARADLLAALREDLDSPRALRRLARVADDPALPGGAKFETFAWADRLLGLDLARDVGRS